MSNIYIENKKFSFDNHLPSNSNEKEDILFIYKKKNKYIFLSHQENNLELKEKIYIKDSIFSNLINYGIYKIINSWLVDNNNNFGIIKKDEKNNQIIFYIKINKNINNNDIKSIKKYINTYKLSNNNENFIFVEQLNFLYKTIFSVSSYDDSENNHIQLLQINWFINITEYKNYIRNKEMHSNLDHRIINKKLNYYFFNKNIGTGVPIWTKRGLEIKNKITNILFKIIKKNNFTIVETPVLGKKELYLKSKHLEHYKDSMFSEIIMNHETFYLRPMTCPHHCILFKNILNNESGIDYFKMFELSKLFRYESSGSLKGIERTRCMTLPDVHIFTKKEFIEKHIIESFNLIKKIFNLFHLKLSSIDLSTPDFNNEKFNDFERKKWDENISILSNIFKNNNTPLNISPGEAAFYAPKIDLQVKTSSSTIITLATIQLDNYLGKRFNLEYDNNTKENYYSIIHVGLIGTIERFISILMEQYNGWLPYVLSSIQILVIPQSKIYYEFANTIKNELEKYAKVRLVFDNNFQASIKQAWKLKPFYMIVIGKNELEKNIFILNNLHKHKKYTLSLNKITDKIKKYEEIYK